MQALHVLQDRPSVAINASYIKLVLKICSSPSYSQLMTYNSLYQKEIIFCKGIVSLKNSKKCISYISQSVQVWHHNLKTAIFLLGGDILDLYYLLWTVLSCMLLTSMLTHFSAGVSLCHHKGKGEAIVGSGVT